MLAKKKKEELEKKQADDPQSAVKAKILDALQSKIAGKAEEEKKIQDEETAEEEEPKV